MRDRRFWLLFAVLVVVAIGGWIVRTFHNKPPQQEKLPDGEKSIVWQPPPEGLPPEDDGTEMEWRFSREKATLAHSVKEHLPDYEVESIPVTPSDTRIKIRPKNDRKVIYSNGYKHEDIVFTRWEDILYIAEYCPIASGCNVVALDLKTGKRQWESRLMESVRPRIQITVIE